MTSGLLTELPPAGGCDSDPGWDACARPLLLDALPVAVLEFERQGLRLVLVGANAAARRMPGLGAVRAPGVDAGQVFDLLADSPLLEQLHGVLRLGAALDTRHVLRESGRLVLAWDIAARRLAPERLLVSVRDISEGESERK